TSSVAAVRAFLQDGGTLLAIGRSTDIGSRLELPISNPLAGLNRRDFYVPGSLLQASVDNRNPLAYGMPDRADFFFDNSPAFRIKKSCSHNHRQNPRGQNSVTYQAWEINVANLAFFCEADVSHVVVIGQTERDEETRNAKSGYHTGLMCRNVLALHEIVPRA